MNLLSQIANLSHPPPVSTLTTYTDSNDNTDGFVPARRHRAVNLNTNTTSKQKTQPAFRSPRSLSCDISNCLNAKRTLCQSEVTLSCNLRDFVNYKEQIWFAVPAQIHGRWSDKRVMVAQTSRVLLNETLLPNQHFLNWHKKTRKITPTKPLGLIVY